MDSQCPSHETVFAELAKVAPEAPFLALGQTAFWDEPMKAGIALCSKALGYSRRFIAGVHDSDYFAKHAGSKRDGRYVVLPHNDTTTKDLWSAAGEFSALFGSETVVRREQLVKAGTRLGKVQRERPSALDQYTEAWGWRGVVLQSDASPVVAETPFLPLQQTLFDALDWAIEETLAAIPKCDAAEATAMVDRLRTIVCDAAGEGSLGDFYQRLLPQIYAYAAQQDVGIETTATTELLRFNTETYDKPRFNLLDRFLRLDSRERFKSAYNEALKGGEIYTLDRFGSWAIPFELVVPGHGRGTIRVAPKAVVIMTPKPLFITTKKPVESVEDLARAVEGKFGKDCTLVGKAVTLIGMLAAEYIFVFHEGASRYVKHSRLLHQLVKDPTLHLNPILRVKYHTWDALKYCQRRFVLPQPLRRPFGADELGTQSFASRWRLVREQQSQLLARLTELRRPVDFVEYLATLLSSSWSYPAQRYREMHEQLMGLHQDLDKLKERKSKVRNEWREVAQQRNALEHEKGRHWRAELFGQKPTAKAIARREELTLLIGTKDDELRSFRARWRKLDDEQQQLVRHPSILSAHRERRELELELELMRMTLVHEATMATQGLTQAGRRPSAWWFPLICRDGVWFKETVQTAEYYLEPLI